jgi:hypothetical protein
MEAMMVEEEEELVAKDDQRGEVYEEEADNIFRVP